MLNVTIVRSEFYNFGQDAAASIRRVIMIREQLRPIANRMLHRLTSLTFLAWSMLANSCACFISISW